MLVSGLLYYCLAGVSQQRTPANRTLARRSSLLRDCDGAGKLKNTIVGVVANRMNYV